MEKELVPLMAALEDAKKKVALEKKVPSYGTLKEWAQARADMLVAAARGAKRGDRSLEPAQVEVDLSGNSASGLLQILSIGHRISEGLNKLAAGRNA